MRNGKEFVEKNGQWLDDLAERNDQLGTLQGVAITIVAVSGMAMDDCGQKSPTGVLEFVDAVQVVFQHGIVEARLSGWPDRHLELLAVRTLTRIDEVSIPVVLSDLDRQDLPDDGDEI